MGGQPHLLAFGAVISDDKFDTDVPDIRHDDLNVVSANMSVGGLNDRPEPVLAFFTHRRRTVLGRSVKHLVAHFSDPADPRLVHLRATEVDSQGDEDWQATVLCSAILATGCVAWRAPAADRVDEPPFGEQKATVFAYLGGDRFCWLEYEPRANEWERHDFNVSFFVVSGRAGDIESLEAWVHDGQPRLLVVRKEGSTTTLYQLGIGGVWFVPVPVVRIEGQHGSVAAVQGARDSYALWCVAPPVAAPANPPLRGVQAVTGPTLIHLNLTSGERWIRIPPSPGSNRNWDGATVSAWDQRAMGDWGVEGGAHFFVIDGSGALFHFWMTNGEWEYEFFPPNGYEEFGVAVTATASKSCRPAVITRRFVPGEVDALVLFRREEDGCVWMVRAPLNQSFRSGEIRGRPFARSVTALSGVPMGWEYTSPPYAAAGSLGTPVPMSRATWQARRDPFASSTGPGLRPGETGSQYLAGPDGLDEPGPRRPLVAALDTWQRDQERLRFLARLAGSKSVGDSIDSETGEAAAVRVPTIVPVPLVADRFARRKEPRPHLQVLVDSLHFREKGRWSLKRGRPGTENSADLGDCAAPCTCD